MPYASGVVSSRRLRNPIRRSHSSSSSPSAVATVTASGCRCCSPYPRGHQSGASSTVNWMVAWHSPVAISAVAVTPQTMAVTVSGMSLARSTSTFRSYPPSAALRGHLRPHLGQSGDTPALQADRAPDPGGHQVRAPVPAEVAGHLADEVVRLVDRRVRPITGPLARRLGVRVRRAELHAQRIDSFDEQCADVEAVRAVHVLGAPDHGSVQQHGRDRVQALAAQVDPRCAVVVPVEAGLVRPVGAPDPGQLDARCRPGTARGSAPRRAGPCARTRVLPPVSARSPRSRSAPARSMPRVAVGSTSTASGSFREAARLGVLNRTTEPDKCTTP